MSRVLVHALFVAMLWLGLGVATDGHAQDPPVFEVVARDGRLVPARLEVPAGQRVKLVVRNEGKSPIEFENLDMRVEKVLAPGATSFVVLPKLKPGEYEFIDEFHADAGRMKVIAK
jgi:uncharacterized cupredoxin-like copper-binding protein